jgi:hypothetical protein
MREIGRGLLIITGLVCLLMAIGYFWQMEWAIATWPWPDGRLTYMFIASMWAAVGAALLWIALARAWGHLAAGGLNLLVTMGGYAIFFGLLAQQQGGDGLWSYVLFGGLAVVVNLLLIGWGHRLELPQRTPLPRPVYYSYILFVVVLLLIGVGLILQQPNIMPWPLQPETSVLVGLIFLGNAFYFVYALLRPYWEYGRAQLWSFLVYDLVLIGPLVAHWPNVLPELRLNLLVYIAVLIYSGALAAYYLFVRRLA